MCLDCSSTFVVRCWLSLRKLSGVDSDCEYFPGHHPEPVVVLLPELLHLNIQLRDRLGLLVAGSRGRLQGGLEPRYLRLGLGGNQPGSGVDLLELSIRAFEARLQPCHFIIHHWEAPSVLHWKF